ncbi:insulinase family protein [Kribbella sandramycini]|uniref:Insulinase family protein n=1 Tax=Kribbella sandramycini TaxID=60450 RepID=A0A7Y4L5M7_9ACTN|nr:insulinase family protein [Kribbella sandramycini]MBB6567037.1 putative Zn-dependent peptidase [Kribbella sandramycini]NOL44758.1 insulinase family protein [Kribbella sandramycini]
MPEYLDGVRVLRHPSTQTHTEATLTFAVGARDETLRTIGVAHALEHLVMSTVRRMPIEMNAEVDVLTTSFMAAGSPERVGEFLEQVCRSLTNPPVDRLALEAGVLAAEDGHAAHPVVALLLYVKYGAQGPGLAWLEGPGYDGLTADHVTALTARWYVKSNAVLQVTGPLPDTLRFELPADAVPQRSYPAGRTFPSRTVIEYAIPAAGVLLTLPPEDAVRRSSLAAEILRQRIEEQCRHVGGHSYEVGGDSVSSTSGAADFIVYAEAREGTEESVARAVVDSLLDLAANGPTDEELNYQVDRYLERLKTEPEGLRHEYNNLLGSLFGEPEVEPFDVDQLRALTPQDIAALLADALPTALAYTPEDTAAIWEPFGFTRGSSCPVTTDLPAGRTFKPPLFARAVIKDARTMRWVRTDDALALRDEDGVHQIRWDEVAGIMRGSADNPTIVFGANGCSIPISTAMFAAADTLLTELEQRVPAELWYDESRLQPGSD